MKYITGPIGMFIVAFFFLVPKATENNASVTKCEFPNNVRVGDTVSINITFKNTGTSTWTSTNKYKLGSKFASPWGEALRIELPGDVAPNEEVSFTVSMTAPNTPGKYPFEFSMVRELVEWFGDLATGTVLVENTPAPIEDLVIPPFRTNSMDVVSTSIFNTGAVPMDKNPHSIRKSIPKNSKPLKLIYFDIWVGAYYNNIADMGVTLSRIRLDGKIDVLRKLGWDHYSNPNFPTNISTTVPTPYGFIFYPGEFIELTWQFNPLGDPMAQKAGQVEVVSWFVNGE